MWKWDQEISQTGILYDYGCYTTKIKPLPTHTHTHANCVFFLITYQSHTLFESE